MCAVVCASERVVSNAIATQVALITIIVIEWGEVVGGGGGTAEGVCGCMCGIFTIAQNLLTSSWRSSSL